MVIESHSCSRLIRICGVVIAGTAWAQSTSADEVPILSVCEVLQNRIAFNGKTVVVVGRSSGTFEGTWLAEDCPTRLNTDGYEWDGLISTTYDASKTAPPPSIRDFKWSQSALKTKLASVKMTTKLRGRGYNDKWVAIVGRFETKERFKVWNRPSGQPIADGFGHLNASPAQLIAPPNGYRQLR